MRTWGLLLFGCLFVAIGVYLFGQGKDVQAALAVVFGAIGLVVAAMLIRSKGRDRAQR